MRPLRTLALALLMFATPALAAPAGSWHVGTGDCHLDHQVYKSPTTTECYVEGILSVAIEICFPTYCRFTAGAEAAFAASVPAFSQVVAKVSSVNTPAPVTCHRENLGLGGSTSCTGTTTANSILVAPGACAGILLEVHGGQAPTPIYGSPWVYRADAVRTVDLCRDANGAPRFEEP